ncbi:MAG: M48 family metallopeptidase [Rhodocyclales bacterium]|nr:M48 family metallopeptidase [Rhodocyclales bacterium]
MAAALTLGAGMSHAGFDLMGSVGAAGDLAKAATISDDEIKNGARQMVAHEDKVQKVAPAGSKYAKRLAALTAKHVKEDGLKLNFKVYMSQQVNAFATPDGSIRVYSGLMDLMTDDELRGVIGHEIGHAKLGHSAAAMKTAYLASAGRKAAASSGGELGAIADSELGAMMEEVLNAQFSQSQETESDDYGLKFMKKHKYDVHAMETALRKLGGQGGGMTDSHPASGDRADRMKEMAGK